MEVPVNSVVGGAPPAAVGIPTAADACQTRHMSRCAMLHAVCRWPTTFFFLLPYATASFTSRVCLYRSIDVFRLTRVSWTPP